MTWLEAIILGAIQGATEFLPISSSGHLVIGEALLGLEEPRLFFSIVLHAGTLLSVMAFYRREIVRVLVGARDGLRAWRDSGELRAFFEPEGVRLAVLVVVATVPTGIIGVALGEVLAPEEGDPLVTPTVVCGLLVVNGVILLANRWLVHREIPEREGAYTLWNVTPWVALLVGIAQGLAVLPGFSRSGLTITAALALGVDRLMAARYSFMLLIPAIVGAMVLEFDPDELGANLGEGLALFGVGAAVAAVTGYICLVLLTRLLEDARFHHFAWYCWIVGAVGLWFFGR